MLDSASVNSISSIPSPKYCMVKESLKPHWSHTCVPVKEGLPPEHGRKLLSNPLEQLLDGRGVANEGGGHLKTSWRDVTHRSFHIVWDPLNKVGAVLVLDVEKLFIDFLHGHSPSEDTSHGEVPPMTRVTGRHHVPSIKHLLGQLGDGEGSENELD